MARIWDEVVDYRQTAEFCRLLGVREDADFEDITKAYRQKALKCHPDKNPDDPQATAKFQELSKAYQHLRDLKKEQDEDFQSEEAWEYFDEEDDPESFAEFLFFLVLRDLYRNGYQPSERDEYRFFTRLNKKFRRYRTEDEDFTEEELQRLHCNKDYIKDKAPGKKKRGKKKVQQDKPPQNVQNRPKKTKKQLKAEQYRREQEIKQLAEEIEKRKAEELERQKKQKEKEKSTSLRSEADKLYSDLSCAETKVDRRPQPSMPEANAEFELTVDEPHGSVHEGEKEARISPRELRKQKKERKKQEREAQLKMRMKTALNIPDAKSPKGTPSTADQCTIEDLQDEASSVIDTDVRRAKLEAFKAKCLATKAQKEQDVQLPKQVVPEDTRPTDESKPSSHADVSHPSATGQGFRAPKPQVCDKALLERHMQQYHELMKQQPRSHTQIQLSVERQPELTHTWTNQQKKGQHNHEEWQELRRVMLQREKEREQQRNRQEQETLRREKTLPHGAAKEWPDPSVNTDATQEQWEDAGASSGQAASGMASGYNHSSQPLGERCQSEGSRMVHEEVWEESGWEDCVQHQAPPAAQAWRNTKPAPPPAVNRWQERLELMSLCPRTEQDEEEMLRKAIELSQQQAVEDEHRRQVKFEKMIEEQKRKYNVFPSNSAQSRRAEPYYNGASDEDFPPISNGASTVVRQAGTSFATCLRQSKTECQEHLPRSHVGMCVPVSEDWESDLTEVVSHPPLMKDAREPCKPMQRPGSAVSSRKIPANPKLHNTSTEQSLESPDDNATEKTTWLLSGESVSEPIWEDTQDEVVSGEGEEMNRKDNGLSRFGHLFSSSNMEENIVNQSEPTALSRDTSGLYCPKENGSAGERFKDVQKSPPKRHLSGCGDTEDSNKSLKAEERCTFSGKPSTVFPFGARQPEGYSQLRNKADQPPVSAPPGFPAPSITPGVHVKAPSGFHEPEIGPLRNPSPPPSDSVGISNPRPPLMTPLPVAVPPPGVLPGIPPTLFPPYPGYPTFPAYPFPGMFPYLPMPAMQSPVYMYSLQQVQHGMGKLSSSHSSEESGGEGNGYNSNRQKMTSYSGNTVDPTQAGPVQAASTAASSGIPTAANSSTVHTTPHMPSPAVHPICKNTNGSEDLQVTQQLANPRSNDGATAKNKETFDRSVSDRIQSFDGEKDPVPHRVTERTTGHSRWVGSRPSSVRHVRGRGEAVGGRLETSGAALEGDSKREPAKTGGLYNKMRSFKRAPVAPRFQQLQDQQQRQRGGQH
ncbi:PREDICTED: actin cytoskeleton-regulatory complex protein PAN1-like isoform X2 [Branchiostoma belcheri]|uniref:Actin cytoskeleton-regulatory complex protein PAN1-like isoform X2 n=1 Tax=Branchiostoma belcheri TaxID=7741 RepID=A0A6P4Z6Y5_BRABE|nr:PREDICTED: actin cytoskeleton-regulatory complex protein PAN1-like isoform X2 [Branchiostoma belcheri]